MKYDIKPNRNAGLWWVSLVSIVVGLSLFFFLEPAEYDVDLQRARLIGLVIAILVPGICLIAGTSRRWFGRDL